MTKIWMKMSKTNKSKKLIEIVDESKLEASKLTLAVDRNVRSLKPYLENLGYRVVSFNSRLDNDEVNDLLIKEKVDFFIAKNRKGLEESIRFMILPMNQYSLIRVSESVLTDLSRLAQAIEKAILYDYEFKKRWGPGVREITGQYITYLPKIKAEYLKSYKK